MSDAAAIAAGWFLDPEDDTQYRWWDGAAWTEHRSPAQVQPAVVAVESTPAAAARVEPAGSAATTSAGGNGTLSASDLQVMAAAQRLLETEPRTPHRADDDGPRFPAYLIALVAVLVVGVPLGGWLVIKGGAPKQAVNPVTGRVPDATITGTSTPAAATSTTAAAAANGGTPATTATEAGGAVPRAIDQATGNGVSKAKAIVAQANAQQAQVDQATNDPSADPMAPAE